MYEKMMEYIQNNKDVILNELISFIKAFLVAFIGVAYVKVETGIVVLAWSSFWLPTILAALKITFDNKYGNQLRESVILKFGSAKDK